MGTYVSINLPENHKSLFKQSFDIFKNLELMFSKYNPDSYLFRLNKYKQSKINREFLNLLKISMYIYNKTNGYFDISLGNITYKYGNFLKDTKFMCSYQKSTGMKNIVIKDKMIYLKNNISLDFGGIGKGYAVDKVAEFLEKHKVKNAVIKASGDIRCFDKCEILIRNPFGDGYIAKFTTKNKHSSISTSGNYEKFINTKDNNHLINPKNKKSQKIFASITLIGIKNNTYLDAFATAISVMPLEEALKFLKSLDIGYILIANNKKIYISSNIHKFVENLDIKIK